MPGARDPGRHPRGDDGGEAEGGSQIRLEQTQEWREDDAAVASGHFSIESARSKITAQGYYSLELSRYLSPETNPRGVKTRLTLLPISSSEEAGYGGGEAEPGYEAQCTLPGSTSVGSLREHRKGSEAQAFKRDLAESDPSFLSKSTEETLRTRSWNEECRWAVSFAASDDNGAILGEDGNESTMDSCGGDEPPPPNASKELRHDTSIHSSWSYFPNPADGPASSPSGNSGNAPVGSAPVGPGNVDESLQVQRLQHQIETLEKELRDPSSMRDRDGMYEELASAKRELRSLKPWWRRFW